MNKKLRGLILTFFCIFIWGITFVSTKYLLSNFSALEILFFRFLFAYICLWIIYPKPLKLKDKKQEISFLMAGLSGVTVYQLMENIAINYTNASNVSIIISVCPLFTALTAQIFLKQKAITKQFIIGFIIAITGVTLVSFNGVIKFNLNPKGDFIALFASICWGFYSLFVSKINSYKYNSISCTRRIFFYALLIMIPLLIGAKHYALPQNNSLYINTDINYNVQRLSVAMNILNLCFLGIVASAFCFLFWNKACNDLGTVYASLGIYLIPVVTIIFAFFALKEPISLMGLIGTACTLCGVLISSIKRS